MTEEARYRPKLLAAYLEYLYSPLRVRRLQPSHYYRPIKPELADAKDIARFPKVNLFDIDDSLVAGRPRRRSTSADGGTFDQVYGRK
jgi:ABC-type sulfate transport system substrate-binding protein